jgi:hypothetical protein
MTRFQRGEENRHGLRQRHTETKALLESTSIPPQTRESNLSNAAAQYAKGLCEESIRLVRKGDGVGPNLW